MALAPGKGAQGLFKHPKLPLYHMVEVGHVIGNFQEVAKRTVGEQTVTCSVDNRVKAFVGFEMAIDCFVQFSAGLRIYFGLLAELTNLFRKQKHGPEHHERDEAECNRAESDRPI